MKNLLTDKSNNSNSKRIKLRNQKRTMSKAIEILTNKFIQDVKNLWELEKQRVSAKEQVERNLMECEDINMIVKEVKKLKKVKKVMIDDDPILPNEPQYNPVTRKIEKPKKIKKVMIDDDPILPNEPQYNPVTKKIEKPKKVKKVMVDDDPILPNEPQMFIPLSLNGNVTLEEYRAYKAQQNMVIKLGWGQYRKEVKWRDLDLHDRIVYVWLRNEFPTMSSDEKRYIRIGCDMEGMDLLTDDDGNILDEAYYHHKDNLDPNNKEYLRELEEYVRTTPNRRYSKND